MTTQRQIDRLTAIRAAEWYELVRSAPGEAPTEFMEWLESPQHMEAFMAVASDAVAMRAAFKSGHFDVEALCRKASSQITALEAPRWSAKEGSTASSKRRWPWLALAAGCSILAIGAGLLKLRWHTFDTGIGEQRILQLADGSIVRLNARSHLEVHMSTQGRDVRLSGEALFKVAPDPRRVFRVQTAHATVQVVGTQFIVDEKRDGSTLVSVIEGKVKVSAGTSGGPLPLAAGEQARVASAGHVERAPAPDIEAATAWQDRKLIFKHTAIENMVDEFNRYNALQLHLDGVPSGQFFYSGIFDADDPRALARLLAREPELRVESGAEQIVIRSAQNTR